MAEETEGQDTGAKVSAASVDPVAVALALGAAGREDAREYEREQLRQIEAWKTQPPSKLQRMVGQAFVPVCWALRKAISPPVIQAALESVDWTAQHTLVIEWLKHQKRHDGSAETSELKHLDALADHFHKWQIGYAVVEGAATGAIGLAGIVADVPLLMTICLRTIRGIGTLYGFNADDDGERRFAIGVLGCASANSIAEKEAALIYLKELQVIVARHTLKHITTVSMVANERSVFFFRSVAGQLGLNLTRRKIVQIVPLIGSSVGALVNAKFVDDVGIAARRMYQERWLQHQNSRMPDRSEIHPQADGVDTVQTWNSA